MAVDNRLNLVEGTGINLTKDAQAQTLTIKTTVNNVELSSPDNSINITSAYDAQTNTRTFNLGVNGGAGTGEHIQLQSEDQSLNITSAYDQSSSTTTFDLRAPQSDWAETDSNSATFIQHKPIEVINYNEGAYSTITTAVNAGKLVMTDKGHVYSKTENNVHYFTKLLFKENEDYPSHYNKANYEIVTVSGDHDWILHHNGGALITNDFIDYAFADPIWDKHDFWGQPSIRLKECPLYRYSYIENNNEQYNLDIPGQTEVIIQNNKLTVIRDIDQPTLDIILYLTHNHVPNFVIETYPTVDCDITIKATYNSQTEPSPIWQTLYYSTGATSATISAGRYYQIKATGSYWSMSDYGTNGGLWNN